MTGAELMREVAMLGAECAMATRSEAVTKSEQGWDVLPAERAALALRLRRFADGADPEWVQLRTELGLVPSACWLVLLCAAVELYPEAAAAVSLLAEDRRVQLVTPTVFARLARAVLGLDYHEALLGALEGGPAQVLGLVEVLEPVSGLPRSQHAVRLRAGVLTALAARQALPCAEALPPRQPPAAHTVFDEVWVRAVASVLAEEGRVGLRSESRRAARQLAADLGTATGAGVYFIDVSDPLPEPTRLDRLGEGLTVLDLQAWPRARALPIAWLEAVTRRIEPLVLLVPSFAEGLPAPLLDVPRLEAVAAQRAWATEVDTATAEQLGARFRLGVEEVRSAAREARHRLRLPGTSASLTLAEALAERARAQGARRMGSSVSVIEPRLELGDLVVPPELGAQLADAIGWYRSSSRVFGEMGLGARGTPGQGLTCLFSGKPGTGKSLAAQCLAGELGLNVYRIDLSQVVSKYIGETEKELSQLFDEAEGGHGVLLFDEADALFGRRSEVKDARDRYANIEVGYLLQRLERFGGIAILTTNLRGNIDAAFMRRLRFVLEFPMPDKGLRRRLWERSLPAPRFRAADLDLETFAERFPLSGGNIENIGMAAAHLAAATPAGIVGNLHLVRSTVRELEKAGRPCAPASFGRLAHLLEEARA